MNKKSVLQYIGIILAFIVLSYGFVPQVLSGKIVNQSDISGYIGMAHEANSWNAEHPDEPALWTNSMFGGMPTTMLNGNQGGDATQPIYDAFFIGKRPASYLLISLLGAFLLMLAFGISPLLAAAGAVAVTFCSYNFQIIQVGHNAKMVAIAWAPWVLAAVVVTYRRALETMAGKEACGRFGKAAAMLAGPVLFGFALNFQIKANHVQISYYLALIIAAYVLVLLAWILLRHHELLKKFFIASGLLLVLGMAGIATNANRLIPTWEYTKQTMRGGSSLTSDGGKKSTGLDFSYATQWSYGLEELPNLMVADFNGGASAAAVNPDKSETVKALQKMGYGRRESRNFAKSLPMYHGPQPFTAGPMYMGVISVFLFILALGLYKGKEKWWLLIPTILAILLALGGTYGRDDFFNTLFRDFNRFWFDHTPFYNKFRTVSMALVVLQITLPLLGVAVLDKILKQEYALKDVRKHVLIATGITGGFCLLLLLFPGIAGSFTSAADKSFPEIMRPALAADRQGLLTSDALVCLGLILATAGLILWQALGKDEQKRLSRATLAGIGISMLVVLNLWVTGKRYLNSGHFVTKSDFNSHFDLREVDKWILADNALDYRVVDLSVNTFNDATPSFHHKNIGGYSPVKFQRYHDLIDHYISGELSSIYRQIQGAATVQEAQEKLGKLPVLSALNCKYIILEGSIPPLENKGALGNAWFVDSCVVASSPDEEIALLGAVDLSRVAVIPADSPVRAAAAGNNDDSIELVSYSPNTLIYFTRTQSERLAVFSEVWCPYGWKMSVDGKPVAAPVKADWTLRAALIPAGEHEITMTFDPASYRTGRAVAAGGSWILILLALAVAIASWKKKRS